MAETWGGWTTKFLHAIGAPVTDSNYAAIYAVIAHEGTSITWNPLAITGAGTPGNSVGVGNFADEATGIKETVNFLSAVGAQDYPGRILVPLRGGNGRLALSGFDATGAWSGDFPGAYDSYTLYLNDSKPDGPYGHSPLLADPGHGQGDIGAVEDITPGIPTISDVLDSINGLLGAFKAVGEFFGELLKEQTWVRIGEILGGVLILGLAISLVNKDIYGKVGDSGVASLAKKAATMAVLA